MILLYLMIVSMPDGSKILQEIDVEAVICIKDYYKAKTVCLIRDEEIIRDGKRIGWHLREFFIELEAKPEE